MKTSHFITPRSLSECQFTVGSADPIVEPSQWIGNTYTSYSDHQQTMTYLAYGVAVIFLVMIVVGSAVTRFL
jgi:hypothetical protein